VSLPLATVRVSFQVVSAGAIAAGSESDPRTERKPELFQKDRDRATRSEVKCSNYTSWIIKVKNTDSSKEFQFLFSAGPGYVIRFSLAIGAEDRMSPYLMYLLNRANRGITATF